MALYRHECEWTLVWGPKLHSQVPDGVRYPITPPPLDTTGLQPAWGLQGAVCEPGLGLPPILGHASQRKPSYGSTTLLHNRFSLVTQLCASQPRRPSQAGPAVQAIPLSIQGGSLMAASAAMLYPASPPCRCGGSSRLVLHDPWLESHASTQTFVTRVQPSG